MDDQRLYEGLAKLERHDEEIKEVKSELKELQAKTSLLTELSLSIKQLAENLKDVKETVTDIKKDQSSIKDEMSDLKTRPDLAKSKFLDKIIIAIIAAIGGAVLTYILKVVFPALF